MSLTSTLRTASSGLQAAQASIRTVSDNIANVNTPGYVRKRVDQQPLVVNGVMYVSTPYGRVVALDAESGKQIWAYQVPGSDQPATRGRGRVDVDRLHAGGHGHAQV